MDEYSVYWIKDEIATHYFHKSGILYRFIKQYHNNKERTDLKLQYAYITNYFLLDHLVNHFKRFNRDDLSIKINGDKVEIRKDKHLISLQISKKHLQFRCCSLRDAEELLFPILRDFEPSLFITGNNIDNYGWISPLVDVRKYDQREVLYSRH